MLDCFGFAVASQQAMLARFSRISTSACVRRASSLPTPLGLAEVQEAAARIARSGVSRTPVIHSAWINEQCGLSVHFKCEHLQRTGSFKFRGAANAVMQLSDERAAKGVVAHSAGNHGAALAAAAAMRCIPCSVIVPRGTSEAKLDNMRRYGANVILCEPNQQARVEAAAAEAARMGGAASIHPYDQAEVIAGQGTIALELLEQSPNLDAILTPTSGGGMLAGIAVAARALKPGLRVIAVEPRGKRLGEALSKGQRVLDPSTANRLLDTCDVHIHVEICCAQFVMLIFSRMTDSMMTS